MCKYLLCALLLLSSIHTAVAGQGSLPAANGPVASPGATVVFHNARFTVLTPELIRMEYAPTGRFEDKASLTFINRALPVPAFSQSIKANTLTIKTAKLLLQYTGNGQPFSANNLSVTIYQDGTKKTYWQPGMKDSLNLKGTMRTLDGANGWDHAAMLEPGIVSRSGWALVDDSKNLLLDGAPDWSWVTERADTTGQDWYLFAYGQNYKKALGDYTTVAGSIPIPPKYAFGYWWSKYWIYNDAELRDLVGKMKQYDIPIDVLVIDMDWHETYGFSGKKPEIDPMGQLKGWTGYTWNKNLFPEPQQFLGWTEQQHLKTALNLHPASGIPTMEAAYGAFAARYHFDTAGHEYIPFRMSDKQWAKTYFDVMLQPLEQQGVDFWWLDWQQYLQDKTFPRLSNTWWLNYTFFTNMERQGKRPLIFHRWGGMGNHRYQIGFSGDAHTSWETLDFQPYFTATASNVGYGYWSHDIGGHISDGKPTDGELYLRWIQFGAFSPILRTHSSKISLIERRLWMFPQYFPAMRDAIKLRYALAPYIYRSAYEAYKTGISICHPMYYDHPGDEKAYAFKSQYMFGSDILAAPVTTPEDSGWLAAKNIWLPAGNNWFEYHSGSLLKGGQVLQRTYAQDEIPFFCKAGAIIPMYPEVHNLQEKPALQVVSFIPGTAKATGYVYEDDGMTNQYQSGHFATRSISRENIDDHTMKIVIVPVAGSYEGMPQQQDWELRLMNSLLPVGVTVNGKAVAAGYQGKDLAALIRIPQLPASAQAEVIVRFDHSFAEQQQVLDGNKAFLRRAVRVTEQLKYDVAAKDWGGTLPNAIYEAGNVPNILLYHPEQVFTRMQQLNQLKQNIPYIIRTIPDLSPVRTAMLIRYLGLTP